MLPVRLAWIAYAYAQGVVVTRFNLARPNVGVAYRCQKRRETLLLLRRRLAPYGWRERLLARFEATIRKEAEHVDG